MLDLKVFNSALEQLEDERGIPRESILEAVEMALASAYKRDFGKKGQIIRAHFDPETGTAGFEQVKIVVTEDTVRMPEEDDEEEGGEGTIQDAPKKTASQEAELPRDSASSPRVSASSPDGEECEEEPPPLYDPEKHIFLEDAKKIKKGAEVDEELIFPLEAKDDYGRIAAQTAKQVIIQKIREAEKVSVLGEYKEREGEIVSGIVQRIDRGNAFVDLNRTVAFLPTEEQIPGEQYRQGSRIKAYILSVEESQRGISIRLSRSHPEFLHKLFEVEAPEIVNGVVTIETIAREPGARSKIAVSTTDPKVDPIGAMVGQRGVRVSTVTNELAGERIDIIQWSDDPERFIADALSPAKIIEVATDEEHKRAVVTVAPDQYSLAIGKGGQNVRLAARLTGWKIDIKGAGGETVAEASEEGNVTIEKEEAAEEATKTTDEKTADAEDGAETTSTESPNMTNEEAKDKPAKDDGANENEEDGAENENNEKDEEKNTDENSESGKEK